jgi:N-acetylneuraminic acid mutarotase
MKIKRSCGMADATIARVRLGRILCSLFFIAAAVAPIGAVASPLSHSSTANFEKQTRALTFAERVAYQRAIEDVYWRHRIWPKERPDPKPSLDAVISWVQLEEKVDDYLRNSQALEDYRLQPLSAEQLQAEMERMAQHTRQPEVLRELFEALGNNPYVIAECLARPVLSERLVTNFYQEQDKEPLGSWRAKAKDQVSQVMVATTANYTLPTISDGVSGCTDDTWTATNNINAPGARGFHTAVWTGSEMIIWGGSALNTGGRYNPSTDSWTATSSVNAPAGRGSHTAVWSGSEMVVWGGYDEHVVPINTGGRYNPTTDSWTATSTTGAPSGRAVHTAVWTGSEMIVWGGSPYTTTGGRYNPSTDSWTPTSLSNVPDARQFHTAVWTGSEMIIWGGSTITVFNTGGRYNPATDSWTATNTTNAPDARLSHTAVWTGSEMIVWGGSGNNGILNTGGRYNPSTDSWTASSTTGAPDARDGHTALWTGSNMIVWGGACCNQPLIYFNTGGRYSPGADTWTATSTTGAPDGRYLHTAIWNGSQMIVWGGANDSGFLNTGGRYCAATPSPTPTPTPRPSLTPRPRPTVRPRPTL